MAKQREISPRAARVWQRLTEWYGIRMVECYGPEMPLEWEKVVTRTGNDAVKRGLALIKIRYAHHPPTLPEFEQALTRETHVDRGPTIADRLVAHVMREHGRHLTPEQIRRPWTHFGADRGEITGVIVPADGAHPGYRVTVDDLQAPTFGDPPLTPEELALA